MENTNYSENQGGNKTTVSILIIIIVLQTALCAFMAWKLYSTQSKIEVIVKERLESTEERDDIKAELDSLIAEHEKIKSQYGELNNKLSEKDSLIQSQIREITSLMGSNVDLKRLRKKMDALRRITQTYVHQIDSLFVVNKELKDENVKVKTDYSLAQQKNDELSKAKDELSNKVNTAAVLKAFKVTGKGIKMKKKGKVEEIEEKAKKAEQVKINFALLENSLIEPGKKNIYVRISGPDEKVLTDGNDDDSHSFILKGERLQFSLKETVNYDGKSTDITLFWKQKDEYKPGVYNVDVFSDSSQIGAGTFSLQK